MNLNNLNKFDFWSLDPYGLDDYLSEQYKAYTKRLIEEIAQYQFDSQINASRYERSPFRLSQRNGYSRPRHLSTTHGDITFKLPVARHAVIRYTFLEKFQRHSHELEYSLLRHVAYGNSYNSVSKLFSGVASPAKISNLMKKIDYEIIEYRMRKIEKEYFALFLDGVWFNLSTSRAVALLVIGVDSTGKKEILDYEVSLKGENVETWNRLLSRIYGRGLTSPKIIIRDRKAGLSDSLELIYPSVPQQNCIIHIMRNISSRLENIVNRYDFCQDLSTLFHVESIHAYNEKFLDFKKKWSEKEPKAINYLENYVDSNTFTYLKFNPNIRKLIYTNNHIERFIGDLRANLKHIRVFPDFISLERFIFLQIYKYNLKEKKVKAEYIPEIKKYFEKKAIITSVLPS